MHIRKGSSPRVCWGTEQAPQGQDMASRLPELQECFSNALRHRVVLLGSLCRARSWTFQLRIFHVSMISYQRAVLGLAKDSIRQQHPKCEQVKREFIPYSSGNSSLTPHLEALRLILKTSEGFQGKDIRERSSRLRILLRMLWLQLHDESI